MGNTILLNAGKGRRDEEMAVHNKKNQAINLLRGTLQNLNDVIEIDRAKKKSLQQSKILIYESRLMI
jgi:hypothetical protein